MKIFNFLNKSKIKSPISILIGIFLINPMYVFADQIPLALDTPSLLQSAPPPNFPQNIVLNAKPQPDFREKEICTAIYLNWNAIPDASKYRIQRDDLLVFEQVAFKDRNTEFTDFRFILPNTNYTYRIFSVIGGEVSSQSQAVTVKTNCANAFFTKKPLKLLVVQMRMKDAQTTDRSVDELKQMIFDDADSISAYYLKASNGVIDLKGEVITGLKLNKNIAEYCETVKAYRVVCNYKLLFEEAYALLSNTQKESSDLFAFVIHGYGEQGWADAYSRQILLNPYPVSLPARSIHELGHIFGWQHSASVVCTDSPYLMPPAVTSGNCRGDIMGIRSGDPFDVTGGLYNQSRNPSTYRKAILNFLAPAEAPLVITKSGTYILQANSSTHRDTTKELRVMLNNSGKSFYSLEYRIPTGLDDVPVSLTETALLDLLGNEGQFNGKLKGVMVRERFDYDGDPARDSDAILKQLITPRKSLYDPYRQIKIEWVEEISNDRVKLKITIPSHPVLPLKAAF